MEKLSEERLKKIEDLFRSPLPGSKIEFAKKAGVDLEELLENLKLSPQERIEKLQRKMCEMEAEEKNRSEKGSLF